MTRYLTFALGIVVLSAIPLFAWLILRSDPGARPDDPDQVALGATVYAAHCAVCHGAQLEGQPNWMQRLPSGRLPAPPHDETGHTWHHPDEQLFGITKHGIAPYAPAGYESDMPAFGEILSDEEIWAVLAYIKAYWPEEIQQRQRAFSER